MRLLLLPGLDGTSKLFKPFLDALPEAEQVKCLVYAADTHFSYAQQVQAVQFMSPEEAPFVIIAESYSTPIAILCAANAPANLKGIVLCAGFAASPLRGWRRWIARGFAPVLFRVRIPRWAIRRFLVGEDAPQELVDTVLQTIRGVRPEVLVARLHEVLRSDVREELAKVATPVLALRAESDRLLGQVCAEEILRVRPSTVVESIEGPHLLLQSRPREAAEAVMQFLQQIS